DVGQHDLQLVQQGTMATIYYKPQFDPAKVDPTARASALDSIKADLERTDAGSVNAACQTRNPALGNCIDPGTGIQYLDKAVGSDTVDAIHPTWHLDVLDPNSRARTGTSGDLVVTLRPGWAAGRAAGTP